MKKGEERVLCIKRERREMRKSEQERERERGERERDRELSIINNHTPNRLLKNIFYFIVNYLP
jgi:hypothetical protein